MSLKVMYGLKSKGFRGVSSDKVVTELKITQGNILTNKHYALYKLNGN